MNRDEENKNSNTQKDQITEKNISQHRTEDDDQHSYPGKLDSVEGSMNNGELGGGIQKQDEQNASHQG